MTRKGIILAGGNGTRLHPLTKIISKHLLPVYDKPMIYYPLSTLMLAGIRDIMVITRPEDEEFYFATLGDGGQFGVKLNYTVQLAPQGIPQAYTIASQWLRGEPSALILGDNLFHGAHFQQVLRRACDRQLHGTIFGYYVAHPERFGVPIFHHGCGFDLKAIVEKPSNPPSSYAVTGLYFLPACASQQAKNLQPSERGELEIAHLLNHYIEQGVLLFEDLGRGFAWLDTGTVDALHMASNYVYTMQWQQGISICDPYEVAWRNDWISESDYQHSRSSAANARRVDSFPAARSQDQNR